MDTDPLATVLAMTSTARNALTLGWGPGGPAFAPPQHGLLAVGPPRCGKTSSVVIPNVLAAAGPVVVASTKSDVLEATWAARSRAGRCFLFDPSGAVRLPPGVERATWSPVSACATWDGALLMADAMVQAARPGAEHTEAVHWLARATELLATTLHSAALDSMPFARVMSFIDTRNVVGIRAPLAREDKGRVLEIIEGITLTDSREQSGIWSTAAGVLSAYRSDAALATTSGTDLDAASLLEGMSTLYICAGSDRQRQAGPLVAGLIRQLRSARYALAQQGAHAPPLVLVLDEVANIAPLHDLPTLVAEGGSQGVVTLACLQDLSQAKQRWGRAADGFFTLFGSKLIFPGVLDRLTLENISAIGGERDVRVTSVTGPRSTGWSAIVGRRPSSTRTEGTRRQRVLPNDVISRGREASALYIDGADVSWVSTQPWWSCELLAAAALGPQGIDRSASRTARRSEGLERSEGSERPARSEGVEVTWPDGRTLGGR